MQAIWLPWFDAVPFAAENIVQIDQKTHETVQYTRATKCYKRKEARPIAVFNSEKLLGKELEQGFVAWNGAGNCSDGGRTATENGFNRRLYIQ